MSQKLESRYRIVLYSELKNSFSILVPPEDGSDVFLVNGIYHVRAIELISFLFSMNYELLGIVSIEANQQNITAPNEVIHYDLSADLRRTAMVDLKMNLARLNNGLPAYEAKFISPEEFNDMLHFISCGVLGVKNLDLILTN